MLEQGLFDETLDFYIVWHDFTAPLKADLDELSFIFLKVHVQQAEWKYIGKLLEKAMVVGLFKRNQELGVNRILPQL